MKKLVLLSLSALLIAGCSKMEEKKMTDNKTMPPVQQNMPNPHGNTPPDQMNQGNVQGNTDTAPDSAVDPKADELSKGAYDFENNYKKDPGVKKELIAKHMAAGNYLMFEANLSPKKKYRPALKHYKRVLELDPENSEALRNKKQIEDIYESMGRPIPND